MRSWTGAFTLPARAKLNVCLHVGPPQPNGLHEIRSLVACLALADELDFEPSTGRLRVDCEGAEIAEPDNLAFRAAAALGHDAEGVRLRIRKRIPLQAGLGGASADAAATLTGIARIARARESRAYSNSDLAAVARSLGSDVPACLEPGFKSISGTGELVRRIDADAPPWGIVLLKPAAGMPTAQAYRLLDVYAEQRGLFRTPLSSRDVTEPATAAIAAKRFDDFCAQVHNDFDPVVRAALPDVALAHDRLRRAGASRALLCGSGSTVAGFFPTMEQAREAAARIELSAGEWSAVTSFSDGT